ncbi:Nucleoporin NDC1 [Armadillidium nasatum]|uniref:Nucleoporin NDC1 n=1 Tax=Armadillidium nasatum TaxID=96803 RepID=A0A5N5T341_9CRUS|nr:Nucleoporin NDC1 [Armadillidium nasatum]
MRKTGLAGPSSSASSTLLRQHTDIKNQQNQKFRFNFKEKITQMKDRIKQFPFVWYLLSDLPDAKNRQIFAESQAVIWAIEGLANIVAKSYTDDQFGVVQKNISDILSALVQTQLIVEKVGRGINFRRSPQGTEKIPNDLQLRKSLRLTLKSSLYIITSNYGESVREVQLSEEVRARIETYLTYQEG